MLSVREVIETFNIPRATAYNWKNSSDWRKELFVLLSSLDKETFFSRNTLIERQIVKKEAELLSLRQLQMAS